MIDLTTRYLGLTLRTPLVPSASPLSQEIASIRRLEDAGASAVVLYSLFEEQLRQESAELDHHLSTGTESFAESLTYFPQASEFRLGPEGYLEHIRKAKEAVDIPIIASLNGATVGGWTKFAQEIEQAGADALECNIYYIPTDPELKAAEIEQTYVDIVWAVKSAISIPVAIKISPFFTNVANVAKRLDDAGADGLVLFNRFYQPDIDLEELEIRPNVLLSTPQALRLPLTWIGILYGKLKASLAATGGIHDPHDAIKMLMEQNHTRKNGRKNSFIISPVEMPAATRSVGGNLLARSITPKITAGTNTHPSCSRQSRFNLLSPTPSNPPMINPPGQIGRAHV